MSPADYSDPTRTVTRSAANSRIHFVRAQNARLSSGGDQNASDYGIVKHYFAMGFHASRGSRSCHDCVHCSARV